MTRALVRMESVLTQLLFDHSLRLRMKDALPETESTPEVPTIVVQNADVSAGAAPNLAQRNIVPNEEEAEESTLNTDTGVKSDKAGTDDGKAEQKKEAATGQGIAGRINVLMAADVSSVLEGRDLPLVFVYTPVQLALCAWYLYRLLSWSELILHLTQELS